MGTAIFVTTPGGDISPLSVRHFSSELELDDCLAAHPELLATALGSEQTPLRLLLIARQAPIDDHDAARTARWSADLLYIDQTGVVTIVEDKLSKNPDIRRKVLGQAIEYAANIGDTLTTHAIRQQLADRYADEFDEKMRELLTDDDEQDDADFDSFWWQVERNLRAGAIRLVFAADVIPSELKRSIEFLNRVTDPLQIAGVEVERRPIADSEDQERHLLVANAVGLSEKARQKTHAASGGQNEPIDSGAFWTEFEKADNGSTGASATRRITSALLESTDLLRSEFYLTPTGGAMCKFYRLSDSLHLLNIRVHPKRNRCSVSTAHSRWRWSPSVVESRDRLIGTTDSPLGKQTRQWLAGDPDRTPHFIEWVLAVAEGRFDA